MKNLREPDVKRLSKLEGNVRRDFHEFFICLEFHIFDVVFSNSY